MTEACRERAASAIREFRLPRYTEIPAVGLYLEQTAKYISEYLDGLMENSMTALCSFYAESGGLMIGYETQA